MNFLHPWAIAVGSAAVALPIAVHLLTRPRPRVMPLSTIRFVQTAVRQKRARHRLRDILILLLRATAVILLACAFGRPLGAEKPLIAAEASGATVRILLLDSSLSMSAISNGQPLFDRARAAAASFVQYVPGLRADLILAAAKPSAVFDSASTNLSALHDALQAADVKPEALDTESAINRAAEIFSKSPHSTDARLELVIFSDFQRTSWARVDFSPLPKDVQIQFESVAPKIQLANLAILRAAAVGRLEAGREFQVQVDVGNFSPSPRSVQADVTLGSATCRLTAVCPAAVVTTLTGPVTLPTPGWAVGQAKLLDMHDALPADDSRPLAVNIQPPPVYALLTRESATPHVSSSHFLERALVPEKSPANGETVIRMDPAQPDRQALASATLLVIDHPGKISTDTINLLAALVRRGHGIFYVAAEPIDAENLRSFAQSAGSDLKMPVEFAAPPTNEPRTDLFLLEWRKNQPPFAGITQTMDAAAGLLRFSGGLGSRRLPDGLADDILATYSDRSACLVITTCGAGTLAVLNVDLSQSNLPGSPIFVPMVAELCGRLLTNQQSTDAKPCGLPIATYLPPQITTAAGLTVKTPDGSPLTNPAISQEGSLMVWRTESAAGPGVYQIMHGKQIIAAAATAAPASESDLQTLDPQLIQTKLAAGRSVYFQTAGENYTKDQSWAWLLAACVACMISELAVLKIFKT